MEIKEIKELVNHVSKSRISELSIEQENGFKITIKAENNSNPVAGSMMYQHSGSSAVTMPVNEIHKEDTHSAKPSNSDTDAASANYVTIKSIMVGTFYRRPAEDKPPYVNLGDNIKEGQVLCIIEAMKMYNEYVSEHSGKIVKILVEDATPVEYDQPLFLIDPTL